MNIPNIPEKRKICTNASIISKKIKISEFTSDNLSKNLENLKKRRQKNNEEFSVDREDLKKIKFTI